MATVTRTFSVLVPPEIRGWSKTFSTIGSAAADVAEVQWDAAGEILFANTRQAVHRLSGDLRGSGSRSTTRSGEQVTTEIEFGSPDVVYAVYELARGGSHDFLAIGWAKSVRTFDRVFPLIWEKVFSTWR